MTVSELQELLAKAIAEGHGELPVRVWEDHGQNAMSAECAEVDHIESDEYMAQLLHPDDVSGFPDAVQCFVISD